MGSSHDVVMEYMERELRKGRGVKNTTLFAGARKIAPSVAELSATGAAQPETHFSCTSTLMSHVLLWIGIVHAHGRLQVIALRPCIVKLRHAGVRARLRPDSREVAPQRPDISSI